MAGAQGRSGRRAKPIEQKLLAGNPGRRPLNTDEPRFTPLKGVEVPEWIKNSNLFLAEIMWNLSVEELCKQNLLCITDLSVLERWCVAYEFWRRAVDEINRDGLTLKTEKGSVIKNPAVTAKKEQESEMTTTGSLLGFDPTSRQRLTGKAGQQKTNNPFLQLISS